MFLFFKVHSRTSGEIISGALSMSDSNACSVESTINQIQLESRKCIILLMDIYLLN